MSGREKKAKTGLEIAQVVHKERDRNFTCKLRKEQNATSYTNQEERWLPEKEVLEAVAEAQKGTLLRKGFTENGLLEALAELEHDQWAHWVTYEDDVTKQGFDPWQKWLKQALTPYVKLSEKEKESDRKWARKVLAVVQPFLVEVLSAKESQLEGCLTNIRLAFKKMQVDLDSRTQCYRDSELDNSNRLKNFWFRQVRDTLLAWKGHFDRLGKELAVGEGHKQ